MRKIKLLIGIVGVILMACEPLEVDIKRAFQFDVSSTYDTRTTIGNSTETQFEIRPEKQLEGTEYYISYEVLSGQGYYKDGNTILSQDQKYPTKHQTFLLQYQGDIVGEHRVKVSVEDNYGQIKEITLTYRIIDKTGFDLTVIPEETSDYVNDVTRFHFNLEQQGDEELTYTMTFSGQKGEFTYDGEKFVTGQQISGINEGVFYMDYRANEITDKDIAITIMASNGVSKTINVSYESLATDFEIVITPNDMNTLYVFSQTFEIHIISPQVDDYRIEYRMYYTSTVGSVNLDLRDLDITSSTTPGSIIDFGIKTFTRGNAYQLGVVEPRKGEFTFVFTDSNGVTNSKTVAVEWYDHVFD
ncbi:hypothetical protein MHTCC0001_31560 [Flavobacteriaceae bacterium MHTCC 0001]